MSGVSRRWASPGEQTITRRSRPTSDHTPTRDWPSFLVVVYSLIVMPQTDTKPWMKPMTAATDNAMTTPTRTFSIAVNTT